VRFELSDEAVALAGAVHPVLSGEVSGAVVRAGWPGGDRRTVAAAWRKLAGVGAVGTLVPEDAGGLGLELDGAVAVLERIGHSGLPVPAVETLAVAAPLLAAAGDAALAEVLAGEALVTAGNLAREGVGDLVPFAQHADLVVLRRDGGLRRYRRSELRCEPCPAVDGSRAVARLVAVDGPGSLLTDDPVQVEAAWLRGVLGASAVLVGLAARMLAMTVDYVRQRQQFGAPVGSFQAVQHALASALVAVEFARPMVLAAGWAQQVGAGPDDPAGGAAAQTSAAKVLASDAARLVARTAIQCHGAMGYTTEYDLHLFAKRAWALVPAWGSPGWHRARLAGALRMGG
jgi:alkylation response protein AidB-like acyl-CoA dehydrogenase